jgi:hypothetical protein
MIKNVKLPLYHAVVARNFVRRRGSNIFLDSRLADGHEVGQLHAPAAVYPPEDDYRNQI